MLLSVTVTILLVLAAFGLVVTAFARRWGVLAFAMFMYAGIAWLLIYGAGHTPTG